MSMCPLCGNTDDSKFSKEHQRRGLLICKNVFDSLGPCNTIIGSYCDTCNKYLSENELVPTTEPSVYKCARCGSIHWEFSRFAASPEFEETRALYSQRMKRAMNIPEDCWRVDNNVLKKYYPNWIERAYLVVPNMINGKVIDTISKDSFGAFLCSENEDDEIPGNGIVVLKIEEGIKYIRDYAFEHVETIRTIFMPSTIEEIGILGCSNLEKIIFRKKNREERKRIKLGWGAANYQKSYILFDDGSWMPAFNGINTVVEF